MDTDDLRPTTTTVEPRPSALLAAAAVLTAEAEDREGFHQAAFSGAGLVSRHYPETVHLQAVASWLVERAQLATP